MFQSKTLFILGAGASLEVGLPTGERLKEIIAEKINIQFDQGIRQYSGDREIKEILRVVSLQENLSSFKPYLEGAWLLRDALPIAISIDNLLEAHRGDKKAELCGKLGIVKCIQEAEQSSRLYTGLYTTNKLDAKRISNTWYPEFAKLLTEGVPKSDLSKIFSNVSFISFNYDRCIEHGLFKMVQVYYNLTDDETKNCLKNLKVLHPYGRLGRLPWQEGSSPIFDFGHDHVDLLESSKQIKTFNEQIHDPDEISSLRKAFSEAEVIVFLGFAFHKQNLDLLNPGTPCSAKRIFGTAYGISGSDCKVIIEDLKSMLEFKYYNSTLFEIRNDLKCVDLFNEYRRSLTAKV